MSDQTPDEQLREMAEHRGLKLVRSRKRKPGTGDFGKYGLTDAGGKPLFGQSDTGLTASASDIEAYLRQGATSTWKTSADTLPDTPSPPRTKNRVRPASDQPDVVIRPRKRTSDLSARSVPRRRAGEALQPPNCLQKQGDCRARGTTRGVPGKAEIADGSREERHDRRVDPSPPPPTPEPELVIRAARTSDVGALVGLVRALRGVDVDADEVGRNLELVRKANGGTLVAEMDIVLGCCAWTVFPTIQHGLIGRLTLLVVDQKFRRRGIASAMLEKASEAFVDSGCTRVEVMSDIEVKNSHNFFRTLNFDQASYRFVRQIKS